MCYQNWQNFPIISVFPALKKALSTHKQVLLSAPPGAGKTSLIPLFLRDHLPPNKKILLLEPRRLAVKNAASFMAKLKDVPLGQEIGYKIRFEQNCSSFTNIIVMSEGLFCKSLINNPELKDIGLVIFDEFHERNLEADFALSLLLDIQEAFNPTLKLLFMSATFDSQKLKDNLSSLVKNNVPLIESKGRAYPVNIRYAPPPLGKDLWLHMSDIILQLLAQEKGGILAFLPGQKEISAVKTLLEKKMPELWRRQTILLPLYGALNQKQQETAILPISEQRKIVLATPIAETSLTLEGISIVVDSGLKRNAIFDSKNNITKLYTQKISFASAKQRAGRAGRQTSGIAVRLWAAEQNNALLPFEKPKILESDLTDMVLDAKAFGIYHIEALPLLTPPPANALKIAIENLKNLNLLDENEQLTSEGRNAKDLPFPARVAPLILRATTPKARYLAILLALILSEAQLRYSLDIEEIMRHLLTEKRAHKWRSIAHKLSQAREVAYDSHLIYQILLSAFANNLAIARGEKGHFLMANGGGVYVDKTHPFAKEKFLIILESTGSAPSRRVLLGCACPEARVMEFLIDKSCYKIESHFCPKVMRFFATKKQNFGAITFKKQDISTEEIPEAEGKEALKKALKDYGLKILPFHDKAKHLHQRLCWLHNHYGAIWPNFEDTLLIEEVGHWLWPFLLNLANFTSLSEDTLCQALIQRLPYPLQQELDQAAPCYYQLKKTGKKLPILYPEGEKLPLLRARIQEFYGEDVHPCLYNPYDKNKIALKLELLSPALRPIQITQDLPNFWQGSWKEIQKEMKSRYPKHFWPENPKLPKKELKIYGL